MFAPLKVIFDRIVISGDLVVQDAGGRSHRFGNGTGSPVEIRILDRHVERRLSFDPQLALGEAFMQGRLTVTQGSIYDFLELMLSNVERQGLPPWLAFGDRLRLLAKRFQQYNPAHRAWANAAHHYDIDGAIYDLFLDADRQYSCAYFDDILDLDEAQLAKKRHIAAKLDLQPNQRVLDIGSGWGGLALYLASLTEVEVKGITLSVEQLQAARLRAARSAFAEKVRFELEDYRSVDGTFDRIVSVGMLEHVGINHYNAYFAKIASLLSDDGVALVHAIGRFDVPTVTNPFIARYIFPGGYIPALSEVLPAIERSGLVNCDVEILRLHYADTLRQWRVRFVANRSAAASLMGETFCRMWEFYLAASETAFRYQKLMVFQIVLAKRQNTLPLTRDYMFDVERRLKRGDTFEQVRRNRAA